MFLCLCCEKAFGLVPVTFSFSVFLVGVLDIDFFIHEELVVHGFDGFVGCFEGVVRYETESFGDSLVIASNLYDC